MENPGSVTVWLGRLQGGDPAAADGLWERYFRRLQGLARVRLPAVLRRTGSEEDVALDAFASLWRGVEGGRFSELASRDHLWRLLVVITLRKVYRLVRTELREQAAVERELDQVLAEDPGPEVVAQAADECRRLMAMLGDTQLETVARLRLDGRTVAEIAAELGCSPRTVDRKVAHPDHMGGRRTCDAGPARRLRGLPVPLARYVDAVCDRFESARCEPASGPRRGLRGRLPRPGPRRPLGRVGTPRLALPRRTEGGPDCLLGAPRRPTAALGRTPAARRPLRVGARDRGPAAWAGCRLHDQEMGRPVAELRRTRGQPAGPGPVRPGARVTGRPRTRASCRCTS